MFETTGSGKVGGLAELFDEEVGVGCIEEVNVSGCAIEDCEGQLFVEGREDAGWFLVGVASCRN